MAQTPKRPPIKVLKVGVGSGGGAIQECDAIKYDGKLWLVPQWLDEPGRGTTKPRRMIRIDSLPHQPMTNEPGRRAAADLLTRDTIVCAKCRSSGPFDRALTRACPLLSRIMKHAPLSSTSQGGEKRRSGMALG